MYDNDFVLSGKSEVIFRWDNNSLIPGIYGLQFKLSKGINFSDIPLIFEIYPWDLYGTGVEYDGDSKDTFFPKGEWNYN